MPEQREFSLYVIQIGKTTRVIAKRQHHSTVIRLLQIFRDTDIRDCTHRDQRSVALPRHGIVCRDMSDRTFTASMNAATAHCEREVNYVETVLR